MLAITRNTLPLVGAKNNDDINPKNSGNKKLFWEGGAMREASSECDMPDVRAVTPLTLVAPLVAVVPLSYANGTLCVFSDRHFVQFISLFQ